SIGPVLATRLVRVPPFVRGLTLRDFLVPIRLGERAAKWQRHFLMVTTGALLIVLDPPVSFSVPANFDVPVTLERFSVLFDSALRGFRRRLAAVVVVMIRGSSGLPVFGLQAPPDDYRAGFERLLSVRGGWMTLRATGGSLSGFFVAAGLVGRLGKLL